MRKYRRLILFVITVFILISIFWGTIIYNRIFGPNIGTPDNKDFSLFIPTGADYDTVLDSLLNNHLLKNVDSFKWVAERKGYPTKIKPGHYVIHPGMSNNSLVNMLRAGLQIPVNVVINTARTTRDLAGIVGRQIEPDSAELVSVLEDETYLAKYGFNRNTILGMFIPDTYEFWWNTSASDFMERMHSEYSGFWNGERTEKARAIKMEPSEIITMASIIVSESNKEDEYARIAGLYMNRLERGMRLQADPTVIYAIGDFSRRRVLTKDLQKDSPYNTYMYSGLPPGPITLPSIKAIDAVLGYEKHDYIYLCARDDFSGYHVFAKTLEQHNRNARLYQIALNQQKIMK
jgi:UPF0755 protein